MSNSFTNATRKLYMSDGAATPAYTLIPTVTVTDNSPSIVQTTRSSADVDSNGVSWPSRQTTGADRTYDVETTQIQTDDATPDLIDVLATIRDMRGQGGNDCKADFVTVEADGTTEVANYNVSNIQSFGGKTEDIAMLKFKLEVSGPVSTFTGSLT